MPWILEVSFMLEVEHLPKCISLQSEMILDLASLRNFPPLHGITIHAFVIFELSFAFASSPPQDLSLEGSVFLRVISVLTAKHHTDLALQLS